jgi:hypothetical protein
MSEEVKNSSETDVFGYHKATVTWFCNAVKTSKRSRTIIDLGFCSQGSGVAFIAVYDPNKPITEQFLKTIVIKDIFINVEKKTCEDAKWCINLSCPLNKAEVRHFKQYGANTRKAVEKLHVLLENIKKELKLEPKSIGTLVHYEKTPIYFEAKHTPGE